MERIDDWSLRQLSSTHDDDPPRVELLVDGQATGCVVSGAVLEAVVACEQGYLIFLTDDVPFEEMLSIYLLDRDYRILDWARVGGPYTTGSFSSLELMPPGRVGFSFIGETNWQTELLQRPVFRLPWPMAWRGVRRPMGFRRHFLVHGRPRPEFGSR